MQREIKFRGWNRFENRMEVVNFIKWYKAQYPQVSTRFYDEQKGKNIDDCHAYGHKDGGDNVVLMQYTGLKDKNGKEIYEGDIVKFLDAGEEGYEYKEGYEFYNAASIEWCNGRFELNNVYDNSSGVLEMMNDESHEEFINELMNDCEVIGNIYDNPELLKGGGQSEIN